MPNSTRPHPTENVAAAPAGGIIGQHYSSIESN
jgi:hypothetical protein